MPNELSGGDNEKPAVRKLRNVIEDCLTKTVLFMFQIFVDKI
jgi:hypothetical protein